MSDGTVLKNTGYGWKVYGKVKDGVSPVEAADRARTRFDNMKNERPALANYVKLFKQIEPSLKRRSLVSMVLDYAGDDIDGAWSDLDDSYETRGQYTLDDLYELYRARQAVKAEIE